MLSLFFANLIGSIVANWRTALLAVGLVLFVVVIGYFSCGRTPKVVIDQGAINKINTANERERKKELEKIIVENSDVVKTVDNRTEIAETNIVERERLLDEKIADVDKKILESKSQGKDVTSAELECLLIPENCR